MIGGSINSRALCLYFLIVALWRRSALCTQAETVEGSLISPENHPDSDNTCADITVRKFYYHKLQMSNVCDARTDILDTSGWIWKQSFFNYFPSGMSQAEFDEVVVRKACGGPYTVPYDCCNIVAAQPTSNACFLQMLECNAASDEMPQILPCLLAFPLQRSHGAWHTVNTGCGTHLAQWRATQQGAPQQPTASVETPAK